MNSVYKELLCKYLDDLIVILKDYQIASWVSRMTSVKKDILSTDDSKKIIELFVPIFAGMGSLNDLYICKSNGHQVEKEKEKEANDKLTKVNRQIKAVLNNAGGHY